MIRQSAEHAHQPQPRPQVRTGNQSKLTYSRSDNPATSTK